LGIGRNAQFLQISDKTILGQTHILYAQLEACESHHGTIPTIITSAALLLRMQKVDASEII
jgi:hypothetical protein